MIRCAIAVRPLRGLLKPFQRSCMANFALIFDQPAQSTTVGIGARLLVAKESFFPADPPRGFDNIQRGKGFNVGSYRISKISKISQNFLILLLRSRRR